MQPIIGLPMPGQLKNNGLCLVSSKPHGKFRVAARPMEGAPRRRAGRRAAGGRGTSRRSGSQPAGGPLCRSRAQPPASGQTLSALSWPTSELVAVWRPVQEPATGCCHRHETVVTCLTQEAKEHSVLACIYRD